MIVGARMLLDVDCVNGDWIDDHACVNIIMEARAYDSPRSSLLQ